MSTAHSSENGEARAIPEEYDRTRSRFEEKFDRDGEGECWDWTASTFPHGYGAFWLDGQVRCAHRVSYRIYKGRIDPGKQINHTCDRRTCVNPAHLHQGSHTANMIDRMQRRDRQVDAENVREIRDRYETEDVTQAELADEYDVTQGAISKIVRREVYAHID